MASGEWWQQLTRGNDVLLDWRCTRCGTTVSAERVHDVYDAAMAWYRVLWNEPMNDHEFDDAQDAFWGACERAKEVERG